jgi:uncharacterized protein YecE (DUF72 family)
MNAQCYIGTSGWNYPAWKGGFYTGIPRREWLSHCAKYFNSVEVNSTFYRLQKLSTFQDWVEQTPDHFKFAIKANRYLTHSKRLKDPDEPVQREHERVIGLGDKLAVVLWQLPASFKKNMERLQYFAQVLDQWQDTRHALEFRDASWFDEEVTDCMLEHRLAICQSDAADWPLWDRVSTDLVYIRLHGHTRTYASSYRQEQLESWAIKVRQWLSEDRDVHIYFDNDAEGHAPYDAQRLISMLRD